MSLIDGRDEKWAAMRKALTPTFTSGKLKGMTGQMDKVVDNMLEYFEHIIKTKGPEINVKEVCVVCTTIPL